MCGLFAPATAAEPDKSWGDSFEVGRWALDRYIQK